ncbi:MAG: asparagine synthase (glutamine-hydrolyzing), partial [Candidatus Dadabacteria bacterium]
LRHRGPDDEGWLFVRTSDGRCIEASGPDTILKVRDRCKDMAGISLQDADLVLGHRRLSIIDLSDAGHQPMSWDGGEYWITYNGEVFNFRELRTELRLLGCRFRTDSDTEVVLAAYSRWGEECVNRFIGQWAFAIYDRKKDRVFCSRDRFGIKPFYYWTDGDSFAFSSAIGTLTALSCVGKIPNCRYLADFVVNGALDHNSETHYEGIRQLLPSHNLTFDLRERTIQTSRYYKAAFTSEFGTYGHHRAIRYADDIRNLLIDAVRMSLVSDVPVGTCLSGGLDSSAVVVIMNRLLSRGESQKAFTIAYHDPAVNEKKFADAVVKHTGVEGFAVYPSGEGFWREIDDFLCRQDGLCQTVNFYAEWCVMRLASSHVKVVLNGQG